MSCSALKSHRIARINSYIIVGHRNTEKAERNDLVMLVLVSKAYWSSSPLGYSTVTDKLVRWELWYKS